MEDIFSRTRMLLGDAALERLRKSRVAVFGVGGVGGYVVEVLARSGVGAIDVFDNDRVSPSNINRQIIALHSTLGQYKVDVAAARIRDINPECIVTVHRMFYLPETADEVDLSVYDYVVDCIDTVTAKIELIRRCHRQDIPLLVCMGAANKMDPTAFRVSDLAKTKVDPLAKVIRRKLRPEGIRHVKVVYSEEIPMKPRFFEISDSNESLNSPKKNIPASNAFVPAAEGLVAGGEVVKELMVES